ncbi:hypothetical protein H6P81_005038 [Aristolochia fimbriata]|uniref:Uncharacterized protein n=1 Tax=Aristolochia fimbriata TaxID=158543 RepID=A0AAV7EUD3_ARIFI|nr:hypothetical protein H6P81_005038 [Aristolochia fimbriata]
MGVSVTEQRREMMKWSQLDLPIDGAAQNLDREKQGENSRGARGRQLVQYGIYLISLSSLAVVQCGWKKGGSGRFRVEAGEKKKGGVRGERGSTEIMWDLSSGAWVHFEGGEGANICIADAAAAAAGCRACMCCSSLSRSVIRHKRRNYLHQATTFCTSWDINIRRPSFSLRGARSTNTSI